MDSITRPDNDSTTAVICEILARSIGCPVEEVTLDAHLVEQLGMDSLAAIKTSVAIEERYGVTMPEFATPAELGLHTVADVVRLASARIHGQEQA